MTLLQENVQRGEQDIGAAEGQICTLKEAQDKLLEELDATRARLRETSNLLTALQVCMSKQARSVFERMLRYCISLQTHQTINMDYQPNVGATSDITLLLRTGFISARF